MKRPTETDPIAAELKRQADELAILASHVAAKRSAMAQMKTAIESLIKALNEKRSPFGSSAVALVRELGIVDAKWYLMQYSDVATSGMDPVEHYVKFGVEEGRLPNPGFRV